MRSVLAPCLTAGIAVAAASVIAVVPVAAIHATGIAHQPVRLAAVSDAFDPVGSLDSLAGALSGDAGPPVASVAGALTAPFGGLPSAITSLEDAANAAESWMATELPAALHSLLGDLTPSETAMGVSAFNGAVFELLAAAGLPLLAGGPVGIVADLAYELAIRQVDNAVLSWLGLPASNAPLPLDPSILTTALSDLTSLLNTGGLTALFNPADWATFVDPSLITDISGFLANLIP